MRKKILTLSAFLLLSAIVWLDRTFHFFPQPSVSTSQTQDVNDWNKYDGKTFTVTKAVDGDTIDIDIPDGKYRTTRIRLLGVDTPETKKPHTPVMYYGPEASKFTADTVLGKKVTVIMDRLSGPRDKYHRLLAYIKLDNGKILNEELISEGFAYAYTPFKHSYYDKYIQLEKTAREQKKGLWEKVTPNQMPKWRQKAEY